MKNNFIHQDLSILHCTEITCDIHDHKEESILWVEIKGKCSHGSQGEHYGKFLYQKIGLALLTFQLLAILIDMRELEYSYGDRIINLFQIFKDVVIYPEEGFITSFVLSDKNRFGLSSLMKIDLEEAESDFHLDLNSAYNHLIKRYDEI
ncbi:hypothetical protein AWW67_11925 [Roseivirga seohaensis]|uniref:Uncharacterized protein n=1 Tax=Roseivirga seohaensis TaxID=1914963 RepID=A0A150XMR9_9BACT|nr:hypothetical protein [Roseivirga seohaensis]KYG80004.1 hypothetical protein AWW67_11925 [Roseivirga seohaensis]